MSSIYHESIIITGYPAVLVDIAREKAKELFGNLVSDGIYSSVNKFKNFIIVSSGSKANWDVDLEHKKNIEKFNYWLNNTIIYDHLLTIGYKPQYLKDNIYYIEDIYNINEYDKIYSTFYSDIKETFADYLNIVCIGYGVNKMGNYDANIKYNQKEKYKELDIN